MSFTKIAFFYSNTGTGRHGHAVYIDADTGQMKEYDSNRDFNDYSGPYRQQSLTHGPSSPENSIGYFIEQQGRSLKVGTEMFTQSNNDTRGGPTSGVTIEFVRRKVPGDTRLLVEYLTKLTEKLEAKILGERRQVVAGINNHIEMAKGIGSYEELLESMKSVPNTHRLAHDNEVSIWGKSKFPYAQILEWQDGEATKDYRAAMQDCAVVLFDRFLNGELVDNARILSPNHYDRLDLKPKDAFYAKRVEQAAVIEETVPTPINAQSDEKTADPTLIENKADTEPKLATLTEPAAKQPTSARPNALLLVAAVAVGIAGREIFGLLKSKAEVEPAKPSPKQRTKARTVASPSLIK